MEQYDFGWSGMGRTVWTARNVVEIAFLLRKEFIKHKVKFVMGKEETWESSCQWTSVPREAIGEAIFFEWELARLGKLESSHGLKKICGDRNTGGSPMICQSEMASVSTSCSILRFWYISLVAICQCILNAPPCGLAEGKIFLFPEKLTQLWHSFDIKFRWVEWITEVLFTQFKYSLKFHLWRDWWALWAQKDLIEGVN